MTKQTATSELKAAQYDLCLSLPPPAPITHIYYEFRRFWYNYDITLKLSLGWIRFKHRDRVGDGKKKRDELSFYTHKKICQKILRIQAFWWEIFHIMKRKAENLILRGRPGVLQNSLWKGADTIADETSALENTILNDTRQKRLINCWGISSLHYRENHILSLPPWQFFNYVMRSALNK